MPIGFMFLGVLLIFICFSGLSNLNKIFCILFCAFTMAGYFINPLDLGKISFNIIITISVIIGFIYFAKNLSKSQMFSVLFLSFTISTIYVALTNLNSDYITSLNPYPIFFVLIIFSLIKIKNFSAVISFNVLSFLFLSLCNLFVESGLGYVHFASLELFNLVLVVLAIMLALKLILYFIFSLKRRTI